MSQTTKKYVLCYPQLGNYDIPIKYFVNHGLNQEYQAPPQMTKRTIELGAKNSPDFVCAPFKCMMGCYIEALENGANVMIGTGGTCRLGYYGELHEQILNDLGYDYEIFNITLANYKNIWGLYKGMRHFAPNTNLFRMVKSLPATAKMICVIDEVEDYYRQNMGFETHDGDFEAAYKLFLQSMRKANTLRDIKRIYKTTMNNFKSIPINKPENPVRIGIVGEYFTIMDPYSNHEIETKLAKMGAEVHRWMSLSHSVILANEKSLFAKLFQYMHFDIKKFPSSIWHKSHLKDIPEYARYDNGGSSIATVKKAKDYAAAGFDGIVQVKCFGCTPETGIVPILHNISKDYKVPILYMNYDTQTSDTGIETRIEAFYDMIAMRKEVKDR
ncbi:MAG: hypothetical protein K6G01_09180 [Eubacterium sp.]|nr:hypothetical protein [Eubacterium sp.]